MKSATNYLRILCVACLLLSGGANAEDNPEAWQALAEHNIDEARVFSSQWCRCLETAQKMDVGPVEEMASLNSFFQSRGDGAMQTRQTISIANVLEGKKPIVLVPHQVKITSLTDVYPASNEGMILALPLSENPSVLAQIEP